MCCYDRDVTGGTSFHGGNHLRLRQIDSLSRRARLKYRYSCLGQQGSIVFESGFFVPYTLSFAEDGLFMTLMWKYSHERLSTVSRVKTLDLYLC